MRPQLPNNIESVPGEHNALIQCWRNAGPLSSTLAQYHSSTGSTSRVCWVTTPQLDIEKINVDIKTSIIKPLHARWLIAVIEEIKQKTYVLSRPLLAWPSHEWITLPRSTAQRQSHPLKPTPKVQKTLMWWTKFRLEYDFALTVLAQNARKLIPCE